jgi:hypothetical protein
MNKGMNKEPGSWVISAVPRADGRSRITTGSGVPARLGLKAAALAWPEGAPAF